MTASGTRLPVQLLAAVITAAVLLLGVWIAGGLLTNDFRTSIALTVLWGGAFGAACLWVAVKNRALRVPVLGGYAVTGAALAVVVGYMTLHDRVVDENIVTGVPASTANAAPRQNVELSSAQFESVEHGSTGRAAVVRLPGGDRRLTFSQFETSAGPDLRVRLVPGDSTDGGADGAIDLGELKGNKGNQQYEVSGDVDLKRYQSVVIWCRAFSVAFAHARLSRS
jgi:hypothetical protein